jgi:transposase InsO family protein
MPITDQWVLSLDISRPGKPTDNAFNESCNYKFRGGMPESALVHVPR